MLKVLFENEELIALEKPSGLDSVSQKQNNKPSAVSYATDVCKFLKNMPEPEFGLLNRLDRGTSGILVFAKTKTAYDKYKKLWKTKAITKSYRAICSLNQSLKNEPKSLDRLKVPQKISLILGNDAKTKTRMRIVRNDHDLKKIRGKPITTITHLLYVKKLKNNLWDITCAIETGARHQIRCTLFEYGYPIVGDTRYQGTPSERLWLHAHRILIEQDTGSMEIVSALPADWPKS